MNTLGQLSLFVAFVASGYAAFVGIAGGRRRRAIERSGVAAGLIGVAALTTVSLVLIHALLVKDFRFQYVAHYSSAELPWYYSLSAFWVGQAGSLLLWAWSLALVAMAFRFWPGRAIGPLREPAFGLLMAYLCFLVAIMVFAADPMEPSLAVPQHGNGLSPLLQHPAMLIHPPIVFLGYALWAVPFALAITAMVSGRLDAQWLRAARPWALSAWAVLGAGILLGGLWAYEELGWGGYWGWDPVENGSLMPWLTGTALIHGLLGWQHRGVLKKTVVLLAIVTFGLCNFATFLTRSGIFSSLHAFSESPIGWMFLALMLALAAGGVALVVWRRSQLGPDWPISTVVSREAVVLISTVALSLLVIVMLVGTISVPLSNLLLGRKITLGTAFYNNVLIPIALLLLAGTASAPLLRWGTRPAPRQRQALLVAAVAAIVAPLVAWLCGVRHPFGLAVAWMAADTLLTLAAALLLDARRYGPRKPWLHLLQAAAGGRRKYAGFLIHVGFVSLVVGVTGSSLGTRRQDVVLREGETVQWAERSIRYVALIERDEPDKFVVEADLEISQSGAPGYHLRPAQYLHRPQDQWSTEVAIRSTWDGDFYTVLHGNRGPHRVSLTLVENPMMRWLWSGGWIALGGVLLALWPVRTASKRQRRPGLAGPAPRTHSLKLAPPHFDRSNQSQKSARTRRRP